MVPAQIVFPGLAAIVTDGATAAVTVIVTSLEVAVVGLAQASDDVITQVTLAPLVNAAFVYVLLLVPTLVPFNFH